MSVEFEKTTVIVTERASSTITATPPREVVVSPRPLNVIEAHPRVTKVESSPVIPVVETCQIRFVRQDPALPTLPSCIVADVLSDDWVEVDSFDASLADSFTWRLQSDDLLASSRVSCFVAATHNGIGSATPSQVKWTTFGKARFGDGPFQCEVRMVSPGGNARMGLFVKVPSGSRVKVWRIQVLG